jgi:uncharacterized membrane protein YhhN
VPIGAQPLLLLPYAVAAILVLRRLWPSLGRLRLPVIVYVVALVAMAWQAAARATTLQTTHAYLAAAGAALFVVSDAILALNRFAKPFRAAQLLVMTTYVTGQALIAASVAPSSPEKRELPHIGEKPKTEGVTPSTRGRETENRRCDPLYRG